MPTPYSDLSQIPTPLANYLRAPLRVERDLTRLVNDQFVTDYVFRAGQTTPNGAVVYDKVKESEDFSRMDREVQAIDELAEFPILTSSDPSPDIAYTTKWGGAVLFSYEKIARDRRDLLGNELRKLRTTVVQKVDRVGMAALNADTDVKTYAAVAVWSDATNSKKVLDLKTAIHRATNTRFGYEPDTVVLNDENLLELGTDESIYNLLPRESRDLNPVLNRQLTGLMNLNFIGSREITHGTAHVLMRRVAGAVHDERAFYSRVVDQPHREAVLIMAGRQTVPVITDPEAVCKITGL